MRREQLLPAAAVRQTQPKTLGYYRRTAASCAGAAAHSPLGAEEGFQSTNCATSAPSLHANGKEELIGTGPCWQQGRDTDPRQRAARQGAVSLGCPLLPEFAEGQGTQSPAEDKHWAAACSARSIASASTSASTKVAQKLLCLLQHSPSGHLQLLQPGNCRYSWH